MLNATYAGNGDAHITGINEIHKVTSGDITFVDFHKYYDKALNSAATFVIINKEVECPEGKGLIFSDDPFRDYVKLVKHFAPFTPSLKNIADNAIVGEGTILFPVYMLAIMLSLVKTVLFIRMLLFTIMPLLVIM